MKTILAAIDLSPVSREICDTACTLARTLAAKVVLLHVVQPAPLNLGTHGIAPPGLRGMLQAMITTLEKRAARQLLALQKRAARSGCPVQVVQRGGFATPVLMAEAAACSADFIVIGSHGRGAAYEMLVGSTAQKILHEARCPVVVVPAAPVKMPRLKSKPAPTMVGKK